MRSCKEIPIDHRASCVASCRKDSSDVRRTLGRFIRRNGCREVSTTHRDNGEQRSSREGTWTISEMSLSSYRRPFPGGEVAKHSPDAERTSHWLDVVVAAL